MTTLYPQGRPVIISSARMPPICGTVIQCNSKAVQVAFSDNDLDWFPIGDVYPMRREVALLRVIDGGKDDKPFDAEADELLF